MPAFRLGTRLFRTKGDAVTEVRRILWAYRPGERVSEADHPLVLALAALHPTKRTTYPEWPACIREFRVLEHGHRGSALHAKARAFYAILTTGEEVAFSYMPCLGLRESGGISEACRRAVADDIIAFKARQLNVPADCHVDHAGEWPFARIVREWQADTSADLALQPGQGGLNVEFASDKTKTEFAAFHRERAQLQLISAAENMSAGSRGYRRKPETIPIREITGAVTFPEHAEQLPLLSPIRRCEHSSCHAPGRYGFGPPGWKQQHWSCRKHRDHFEALRA